MTGLRPIIRSHHDEIVAIARRGGIPVVVVDPTPADAQALQAGWGWDGSCTVFALRKERRAQLVRTGDELGRFLLPRRRKPYRFLVAHRDQIIPSTLESRA